MNNKNKEWTGNIATPFAQIGAKNFAKNDREEHDYYASHPQALEDLLKYEQFENVWEPACGAGHLAKVLDKYKILGRATDLYDHGYGEIGIDFLSQTEQWNGDIITNPPYRFAQDFAEQALRLIPEGRKVAMLLKIQFLEGKRRAKMYAKNPPKRIYIWPWRIYCAINGDFENVRHGSPMMFCFIIWEKGFYGDPIIKWFENESPEWRKGKQPTLL